MTVTAPERTAQCGHAINTSKGVKACVKPAGHATDPALITKHGKGHSSRATGPQAARRPVPKSVITSFSRVPHTETVEYGGGRSGADRTDLQKMTDAHVKTNYDEWVKAGKKDLSFNDAIKAGLASRYFLDSPEDYDEVARMIRSGARLHNIGARVGPLKRDDKGRHMVYWTAQDTRPKTPGSR